MNKIYLSRRNLLALLSKLDRVALGETSECTIIKNRNDDVKTYQQTMESVYVIAVDDEEYYNTQQRPAGLMWPSDEVKLDVPSTGVELGGFIL